VSRSEHRTDNRTPHKLGAIYMAAKKKTAAKKSTKKKTAKKGKK
jgi:hypothetical protein